MSCENILYSAENANLTHCFHIVIELMLYSKSLGSFFCAEKAARLPKEWGKNIHSRTDCCIRAHSKGANQLLIKPVKKYLVRISRLHAFQSI